MLGGKTIKDCICMDDKWLDVNTLECKTTNYCSAGQYVVEYGTSTSNYNCSMCSMCPPATWRNMLKCLPSEDNNLDASDPTECVPCGPCGPGYYRNMSACNGRTDKPGDFCVKCSTCPSMHNINTSSFCDGNGIRDTTQCIFCSEPCGPNADNLYIPSVKDGQSEIGCDGKTLSDRGRSESLYLNLMSRRPGFHLRNFTWYKLYTYSISWTPRG
jgi:hypothetical protein